MSCSDRRRSRLVPWLPLLILSTRSAQLAVPPPPAPAPVPRRPIPTCRSLLARLSASRVARWKQGCGARSLPMPTIRLSNTIGTRLGAGIRVEPDAGMPGRAAACRRGGAPHEASPDWAGRTRTQRPSMVKPAPEPSRRTRRCSLVASAPQPPKYRLLGRPPHGWPPDVLGRRFQRSCHPRSGSTRHPPQRGDRPRARGHRHGSGISNVQNSAWKDSESIRARHPSDIHPCGREGTGRATPPPPPTAPPDAAAAWPQTEYLGFEPSGQTAKGTRKPIALRTSSASRIFVGN